MSNVEHIGTTQFIEGPEYGPVMHTYRIKEGATVHIHGIPVRVGADVLVSTATDLRVVPPTDGDPGLPVGA